MAVFPDRERLRSGLERLPDARAGIAERLGAVRLAAFARIGNGRPVEGDEGPPGEIVEHRKTNRLLPARRPDDRARRAAQRRSRPRRGPREQARARRRAAFAVIGLPSRPSVNRPWPRASRRKHEKAARHGDVLLELDRLIRAEMEEYCGQDAEPAERDAAHRVLSPTRTRSPPPNSVRITSGNKASATPCCAI